MARYAAAYIFTKTSKSGGTSSNTAPAAVTGKPGGRAVPKSGATETGAAPASAAGGSAAGGSAPAAAAAAGTTPGSLPAVLAAKLAKLDEPETVAE